MPRRSLAGLLLLLCVTSAFAEDSAPNPGAAAGANTPPVAAGDHWTYEIKDEISGEIKFTRTDMVTDVSKNDIAVRFDFDKTGRLANILYDQSWNVLRDDPFKYSPNDGTGVQLPLTTGAQWKFAIDVVNSRNGMTFRRTGNSRVTGQESITTKAGSFNAFVIETNYTGKNVQDPTLINQTSTRMWFDPGIDHWVKRNIVIRQRGHVVQSSTVELVDYGHKKQ